MDGFSHAQDSSHFTSEESYAEMAIPLGPGEAGYEQQQNDVEMAEAPSWPNSTSDFDFSFNTSHPVPNRRISINTAVPVTHFTDQTYQ